MKIKKQIIAAFLFACLSLTACADKGTSSSSSGTSALDSVNSQEEKEHETVPEEQVGYEGMVPIYPGGVADGEYDITVDSSSSMFKITACKLTVSNGEMTAAMTMSGKGYEHLFMGTEDEAATSDASHYIKYEEKDGAHVFTVPVEALNQVINCSAFSKKKQEWYGRKLVFRSDDIPVDALTEEMGTPIEALELEDGKYFVDVALEGGSGKAFVTSPCEVTIKDGKATAKIEWSSDKYDYMIVDGQKYDPTIKDGSSVFNIPVVVFDCDMRVKADTTAMSEPHEIDYALYFDSTTVTQE